MMRSGRLISNLLLLPIQMMIMAVVIMKIPLKLHWKHCGMALTGISKVMT